jgi:hypothetical protein
LQAREQMRNVVVQEGRIKEAVSSSDLQTRRLVEVCKSARKEWMEIPVDSQGILEGAYQKVIQETLQTIIPLVALFILQLWVSSGEQVDWDSILRIVLRIRFQRVIKQKTSTNTTFEPDFAIVGDHPAGPDMGVQPIQGPLYICNVDAKNCSNAEKLYTHRGARSKDQYISELVQDRASLSNGFRNQERQTSWRAMTFHLLAQVCVYTHFYYLEIRPVKILID